MPLVYLFTDKGLMQCSTEALWGKNKWQRRTPRKLKKKQKRYAYKVKVKHRIKRIKESIEPIKHNKVMIVEGGRTGPTYRDYVMRGVFRKAIDERGKSKREVQAYLHPQR